MNQRNSNSTEDYESLLLNAVPLLDVRAPVEYARGAFPNSSNLPLMNDSERHLVGLEYKRAGQARAIELGAELIPRSERDCRVASWLEYANENPQGVLYCFRGGLRSRITQQWLADAGCHYPLVKGGYKALRTYAMQRLEALCQQLPFTLISGRTGIGKTILINQLQRSVDLEGLALHRGSSFGRMAIKQPSNIGFEHALTIELMRYASADTSPVYLEDESRMIGSVCIPAPMREAMLQAPVVILEAPISVRIKNGLDDYVHDLLQRYQLKCGEQAGFDAFSAHHTDSLLRVKKRLGGERYATAKALLESALNEHQRTGDVNAYAPFIELLLTRYYDPMYDYQMQSKQDRVLFRGDHDAILGWVADRCS